MLGGEHYTLADLCDSWIHDCLFFPFLSFLSVSLAHTHSAKFSAQRASQMNWNKFNLRAFSLHQRLRCYKIWIYKYWINMSQKKWLRECSLLLCTICVVGGKAERIMQPSKWDQTVFTMLLGWSRPLALYENRKRVNIFLMCTFITLHYPLLVGFTHSTH